MEKSIALLALLTIFSIGGPLLAKTNIFEALPLREEIVSFTGLALPMLVVGKAMRSLGPTLPLAKDMPLLA